MSTIPCRPNVRSVFSCTVASTECCDVNLRVYVWASCSLSVRSFVTSPLSSAGLLHLPVPPDTGPEFANTILDELTLSVPLDEAVELLLLATAHT
jgi:hypothetical protein